MRILIIGAGALGGLFGALLSTAAETALLTTNRLHAERVRQHGLLLTGLDGKTRSIAVEMLTSPAQYAQGGRQADLVLICVKARATARAAATGRGLLAKDGRMLTLQNGLGNYEQIAAIAGAEQTLAGVTGQAATLLGPGHVRHAGTGLTRLGARERQWARASAIAALFTRAGIPAEVTGDLDSLLWEKLLVNVGINALAALLRVPNGVLAEVPACRRLMTLAVSEAVAVARARGIALPGGGGFLGLRRELRRVRAVCRLTAANQASMLQDVLRGAPTEIDVINGAVVREGRKAGLVVPANQLITRLVRALEDTAASRAGGMEPEPGGGAFASFT